MMFVETRGNDGKNPKSVKFSYAILNPSASFGGLYSPETLPKFDKDFFTRMSGKNYKELALEILRLFQIDIEERILREALDLYDKFDNKNSPAPLVKIKPDLFVNELYHGPTRAFKDMALQPFGYILSYLAQKQGEKYLILAATSGDTGPATLDTFENKENIQVVCLYPSGGTSDVQRLQMITAEGKNIKVIGIHGNFDDAQNALKSLLASNSFRENLKKQNISLSAANSVNFGRIIFQIIYHVSSYIELLKQNELKIGDKFYITVPSGNFGNALGAYYAKKIGLPIEKILITSNINNILTDLLTTGVYDVSKRELLQSTSPAMDILISSNVERVLFDKFGNQRCKELMSELSQNRTYTLSKNELEALREEFDAVYSDDEFAIKTIAKFAKEGYVLDPHTATCIKAYEKLKQKDIPCVICSTAEWTKFAPVMWSALQNNGKKQADKEALENFSKALNLTIPKCISSLFEKEIKHPDVVEKTQIEKSITDFLKGSS
ncbi:MAG: threonine synthase [Campylobacteraceae bacterium]|jgi:threonine synthase|nr:threonine synthase [Campylobacteraceae bacterium]